MILTCGIVMAMGSCQSHTKAMHPMSDSLTDKPNTRDILVGIEYFAGWWEPLPNKWHRHTSSQSSSCGDDWRGDFPERIPLLGSFNTQETMDKEIVAASSHGVDFFMMLWYYNEPGRDREPHSRHLNNGLKYFIKSPEAGQMKFMVEFCNQPPYEVETDEQWQQCIESWIEMFKHPSYLRIGGRLVFKVLGGQYFINQNKGDLARCRQQLDSLRLAVREATGSEMIIGCGVMALDQIHADHPITKLFDFTCTYMDVPPYPQKPENYPYEMLADMGRAARLIHYQDGKPYMPYLPSGWCPRPWPDQRAYFHQPNQQQWTLELKRMKEDLLNLPNLGLPLPDGSIQPMFSCYAWNEFGEGGYIAPTAGEGYMKLEAIREVFGVKKRE